MKIQKIKIGIILLVCCIFTSFAQITVHRTDGYSGEKIVRGTAGKYLFEVSINASEDVVINKISFVNIGHNRFQNLVSLQLIDNDNVIDSGNLQDGTIVFNNYESTITGGSSKRFAIRATFSTSIDTNSIFQLMLIPSGLSIKKTNGQAITPYFTPISSTLYTITGSYGFVNITDISEFLGKSESLLLSSGSNTRLMNIGLEGWHEQGRVTDIYLSIIGDQSIDNNRISQASLIWNNTVIGTGSVFEKGIRFNLTDSSPLIVGANGMNGGATTGLQVQIDLNTATTSGAYTMTGLQLQLGTSGMPTSEIRQGTQYGLRVISVNTGTPLKVYTISGFNSPQHKVVAKGAIASPIGSNNGFNGSTTAYKFKLNPTGNYSGQIQVQNIQVQCTFTGSPVGTYLMNGDVNSSNALSDRMSSMTTIPGNGTPTWISVTPPSNWNFSSERSFTLALDSSIPTTSSRGCQVSDINISEIFADGTIRNIGNLSQFQNTGMINLTPGVILESTIASSDVRLESIESISVYPNPVTDTINISWSQPDPSTLISVYNIYGIKVLQSAYTPQLRVSSLIDGIYSIKIGKHGPFRFIKQ